MDVAFREITLASVRVHEGAGLAQALSLLAADLDAFRPMCSKPFSLSDTALTVNAAVADNQGLKVTFRTGV